eukprot:2753733-Pyramimonas_sp.AAC.1
MFVEQGILAGCSFATSPPFHKKKRRVDVPCEAARLYPSMSLHNVVGGIAVGAVGKRKHVIHMVLGATRFICVQLELLGFTISPAKGIATGSSAQVAQ